MGMLTNPRSGNGKIVQLVLKWERIICFLMYIGGITWLGLLALPAFNDKTYFSENALLPGLVTKESNLESSAKQFHRELLDEMERYPDSMPYAWLLGKFHQLSLDVYTHNFTLKYPFREQQFSGQNIYGVVRAPRAASTEAIVVSVPFRPLRSVHLTTAPSIALLLAFAKFCRKQKYWAKDIIFLITEHEQLGMQAWLDAYHGVTSGQEDVLISGDLAGRSGSIQAAINLEMHAMKIQSIDIKVEGLNGQLPNLDLFNLAQNMINKEGISKTFQKRIAHTYRDKYTNWLYHMTTMSQMILSQATGVPTGNHGLFHRFGIEAITLEGFEKSTGSLRTDTNFYQIGRIIESIVRSLNNLLERFHQSFFFYLLASTERYISIGVYMRPLVLIIGGLFIKALCMWIRNSKPENSKTNKPTKEEGFYAGSVASEIMWAHIFGAVVMSVPKLITTIGLNFQLKTEDSIFYGFALISLVTLFWPFKFKRREQQENVSLLCVIALVEMGTVLMCISMHNFSLALLSSILYAPLVLSITPKSGETEQPRKFLRSLWILVHPFVASSMLVMIYTMYNFHEERPLQVLNRGLSATKQAFVYSILDSMIYGNWYFNVMSAVILPIWLMLWKVISTDTVKAS